MKFKELLEIIDPDTYVRINDIEHNNGIECDADNSFLQFAGELTVEKIFSTGMLSLDLSQKRIEE